MAGFQPVMAPGPVEYKRNYDVLVLVLLVLFCWPAAIIYYFTRETVPVQQWHTYAMPVQWQPAYGGPAVDPNAPPCPRCGRPATWVAQYNRWFCSTEQQYI